MDIKDCIFLQLAKAAQAGKGYWGHQVSHLGVTATQALVLAFLGEEDRISSHVLSDKLRLTSPTVTGILDRLQKMELVERIPNPDDRRAILVCLAEKGKQLAEDIREIADAANKDFLASFSEEEEFMLRGLLGRIVT